jgi:transcriptional regulator with XRE-family HTH domain
MGRAALNWSTLDLAKKAGVGGNTVNRFEAGQDARVSSVDKMRAALEAAGVEFIAENGGGAGVRLRKKAGATEEGIRPENLNASNDG